MRWEFCWIVFHIIVKAFRKNDGIPTYIMYILSSQVKTLKQTRDLSCPFTIKFVYDVTDTIR